MPPRTPGHSSPMNMEKNWVEGVVTFTGHGTTPVLVRNSNRLVKTVTRLSSGKYRLTFTHEWKYIDAVVNVVEDAVRHCKVFAKAVGPTNDPNTVDLVNRDDAGALQDSVGKEFVVHLKMER